MILSRFAWSKLFWITFVRFVHFFNFDVVVFLLKEIPDKDFLSQRNHKMLCRLQLGPGIRTMQANIDQGWWWWWWWWRWWWWWSSSSLQCWLWYGQNTREWTQCGRFFVNKAHYYHFAKSIILMKVMILMKIILNHHRNDNDWLKHREGLLVMWNMWQAALWELTYGNSQANAMNSKECTIYYELVLNMVFGQV